MRIVSSPASRSLQSLRSPPVDIHARHTPPPLSARPISPRTPIDSESPHSAPLRVHRCNARDALPNSSSRADTSYCVAVRARSFQKRTKLLLRANWLGPYQTQIRFWPRSSSSSMHLPCITMLDASSNMTDALASNFLYAVSENCRWLNDFGFRVRIMLHTEILALHFADVLDCRSPHTPRLSIPRLGSCQPPRRL